MNVFRPFSLNIRGKLHIFDRPLVMGIVNVTPDSFFADSRTYDDNAIKARVRKMLDEGADIIDIGAYSSRPGADEVSVEEETMRIAKGMTAIRQIAPDAIISVDTFRADVARGAVESFRGAIIKGTSGGELGE